MLSSDCIYYVLYLPLIVLYFSEQAPVAWWIGGFSLSIRVLTTVVRALLRSHVGKPSSAYGWSGVFSLGSPVFAHL